MAEKLYVVLDGEHGEGGMRAFVEIEDDDGNGVHVGSFRMQREGYVEGTVNIGPLYRLDDGEVVLTREDAKLAYDLVVAKTEIMDNAEMLAMSDLGGKSYRELRRKLRAEVMP